MLLTGLNLSAATLHVSLESPNPRPPFATWATAATNIQQAVDAASAGDEILVTNGVYATGGKAAGTNALLNRVAVEKPLTLRSVNGPQLTIIQGYQVPGTTNGHGAVRCVHLADGARLSGFTLTNGATLSYWDGWDGSEGSGGGVHCASTNAMLTNCLITGNAASHGGGGASDGTLYDCTITSNSAFYCAGVKGGILYRCTLTGNLSSPSNGEGAAVGSILLNCTLTGNTGPGAFDSTLRGCLVDGNSGPGVWQCILYDCMVRGNYGGGAVLSDLYNLNPASKRIREADLGLC
jgi:hypothetical protein